MNPVLLLDNQWRVDRVISVERACELILEDLVTAASEEIAFVMHSQRLEIVVPSVVARVRSTGRMRPYRDPICTPRRVRIRDRHVCQFVVDGRPCTRTGDSADHLVPQSLGGLSTWTNLVAACKVHNGFKRDRTIDDMHRHYGWSLRKSPVVPTYQDVVVGEIRGVRPGWEPYLLVS
jgi:5-methylcytosine-specific restriction endonuclease McrA